MDLARRRTGGIRGAEEAEDPARRRVLDLESDALADAKRIGYQIAVGVGAIEKSRAAVKQALPSGFTWPEANPWPSKPFVVTRESVKALRRTTPFKKQLKPNDPEAQAELELLLSIVLGLESED